MCCLNSEYQLSEVSYRPRRASLRPSSCANGLSPAVSHSVDDPRQLVARAVGAARRDGFADEDVARLEVVVAEDGMAREMVGVRVGELDPAYAVGKRLEDDAVGRLQDCAHGHCLSAEHSDRIGQKTLDSLTIFCIAAAKGCPGIAGTLLEFSQGARNGNHQLLLVRRAKCIPDIVERDQSWTVFLQRVLELFPICSKCVARIQHGRDEMAELAMGCVLHVSYGSQFIVECAQPDKNVLWKGAGSLLEMDAEHAFSTRVGDDFVVGQPGRINNISKDLLKNKLVRDQASFLIFCHVAGPHY